MNSQRASSGGPGGAGISVPNGGSHRLETFVDAAFAFALTLLVISFDAVPASYDELLLALRGVPAFLASFAIIVMLWVAHRNWSRKYGLEDTSSLLISIGLVFVVMVYVYPLRAMMSVAVNAITGGWAPSGFQIDSFDQVRGLFTIYGVGFAASTACIVLLYQRAYRCAPLLGLSRFEQVSARNEVIVWSTVSGMGVVSVVLAQTLPTRLIGLAGWVYCLLAIGTPALGIYLARRAEPLRSPD